MRFLLLAVLTTSVPAQTGALELRILHTNDRQGRLMPMDATWVRAVDPPRVGGASALLRRLAAHRRQVPEALLLSAGDWFHGAPEAAVTGGRMVLDFMNLAGYDFATVGNHDFELGEARLAELVERARFPVFGANVRDRATGARRPWVAPSHIVTVEGVRIGLGGVTARTAAAITFERKIRGLAFGDPVEEARAVAAGLRANGAEMIVLLNHLGPDVNERIATAVPGIDILVGGDRHEAVLPYGRQVGRTLIAQAAPHGVLLGVIRIRFDPRTRRVVESVAAVEVLEPPGEPHPGVLALRERYRGALATLERPVADVPATLHRQPPGEKRRWRAASSALGNWTADVVRDTMQAEIGLVSRGSIGTDLRRGRTTVRDLHAIYSRGEERLMSALLTGEQVRVILEKSTKQGAPGLEISGLTVRYVPRSERVRLEDVRVTGEPLAAERIYRVGTSEFVNHLGWLAGARKIRFSKRLLVDAAVEAAERQKSIEVPPSAERWVR